MRDFKQVLMENGYSRQEELVFWDCDRNKRVRVAALLSKAAAFAGYDYDARGLTHETLYAMREAFLLSRLALRIHDCPRAGEVLTITTWENGAREPMCSGSTRWRTRRDGCGCPSRAIGF